MTTITSVDVHDIRFPTSRVLAGSDAMNPDPDYSAAYVVLGTNDDVEGHGFTFTIGRGNELCVAAIEALRPLLIGRDIGCVTSDLGGLWRQLTGDSQLRWVGPEKGVIHLATAAVVNAAWDLYAKRAGKPLWKLLADMSPDELVACAEFRYLSGTLEPGEAQALLQAAAGGREAREQRLAREGFPAYTTSVGWLGYDDDTVVERTRAALDAGWDQVKLKVGADLDDDLRRVRLVRDLIGPQRKLMLDANQRWEVPEAIRNMERLAECEPFWIEEPTSPDDILGHAAIATAVAPVRVATGEHVHNRIMFKQLFQAGAIGVCQLDMCRVGGVNEALSVLLLAAKFGIPVCPHTGGVGLCEYAQHLSMFDYVAVAGSLEERMIEYVDHLHEHFVDPVRIEGGRYQVPAAPGASAEMHPGSLAHYRYPDGLAWAG